MSGKSNRGAKSLPHGAGACSPCPCSRCSSSRSRRRRRWRARRRDVADGGPGDGDIGRLHEPAVLRHEADHARHPRRLRHQRLVAGVVRGRALRGREVQERQADRRASAAADLAEVHLRRQLDGRAGRQRDRDDPRLRPGAARVDPGGHGGRRQGRPVGRRSGRHARQGLRHLRRLELADRGHHVGQLDGQAARRQGQRRLPRRPGRQPGHHRPAEVDRQGLRQAPRHEAPDGQDDLARDELGSGDRAEADERAARQVPEDRRDHLRLRHGRTGRHARHSRRPTASSCRSATLDANGLSCLYKKVHKSNPAFQLATISSRNWLGRVAARKAIAAAQGLPNKEPSTLRAAVLRELGQRPGAGLRAERGARLLLLEQAHAGRPITKYGKPS